MINAQNHIQHTVLRAAAQAQAGRPHLPLAQASALSAFSEALMAEQQAEAVPAAAAVDGPRAGPRRQILPVDGDAGAAIASPPCADAAGQRMATGLAGTADAVIDGAPAAARAEPAIVPAMLAFPDPAAAALGPASLAATPSGQPPAVLAASLVPQAAAAIPGQPLQQQSAAPAGLMPAPVGQARVAEGRPDRTGARLSAGWTATQPTAASDVSGDVRRSAALAGAGAASPSAAPPRAEVGTGDAVIDDAAEAALTQSAALPAVLAVADPAAAALAPASLLATPSALSQPPAVLATSVVPQAAAGIPTQSLQPLQRQSAAPAGLVPALVGQARPAEGRPDRTEARLSAGWTATQPTAAGVVSGGVRRPAALAGAGAASPSAAPPRAESAGQRLAAGLAGTGDAVIDDAAEVALTPPAAVPAVLAVADPAAAATGGLPRPAAVPALRLAAVPTDAASPAADRTHDASAPAVPVEAGRLHLQVQSPETGRLDLDLRFDGSGQAQLLVQTDSQAREQALAERTGQLVDAMRDLGLQVQVDVRHGGGQGGTSGQQTTDGQPQGGAREPWLHRPEASASDTPAAAAPAVRRSSPADGQALHLYA